MQNFFLVMFRTHKDAKYKFYDLFFHSDIPNSTYERAVDDGKV